MDYSNNHNSGSMEPNSVSLAMFASIGFHAVLFVLMAFFPAASETVKKPLRIVNLLPPSQSPSTSPQQPQAKTSTLEDILQNPLPDLSAGFPPLGNADSSSIQAAPDTSSYLGNNRSSFNPKVNTDNIKTTDIPTRSFTPTPSSPPSSSSSNQTKPPFPKVPSPKLANPSGITPAPNTSIGQPGFPGATGILPAPPNVIGAAPEPTGRTFPGTFPGIFPEGPSQLQQPAGTPRKIPPSQQTTIPIISTAIPFRYPPAACPNALQGTATVAYYRQPNGTYVDGSGVFENSSGSSILDDTALNAVLNTTAPGTGDYQRYSSRFDFVYSEKVCSQTESAAGSPSTQPGSPPSSDQPASPSGNDSSEEQTSDSPSSETPKSEPKDTNPRSDGGTSSPSKAPKTPDSNVEESSTSTSKPKPNSAQGKNKKPEPVLPPTQANPIQVPSKSVPAEPVEPKPAQPKPAELIEPKPTSSPVPEASQAPDPKPPKGAAADLVPLEPVTPGPQAPVPQAPVNPAPAELKLPVTKPEPKPN